MFIAHNWQLKGFASLTLLLSILTRTSHCARFTLHTSLCSHSPSKPLHLTLPTFPSSQLAIFTHVPAIFLTFRPPPHLPHPLCPPSPPPRLAESFDEEKELSLRSLHASPFGASLLLTLLLAWYVGYAGFHPLWALLAAALPLDSLRLRLRQTFLRAHSAIATSTQPLPPAGELCELVLMRGWVRERLAEVERRGVGGRVGAECGRERGGKRAELGDRVGWGVGETVGERGSGGGERELE